MIESLEAQYSQELLEEVDALEKLRHYFLQRIDQSHTAQEYFSTFVDSSCGEEFVRKVKTEQSLRVLDSGCGAGESSVYLASQGYDVISIEPSPLFCEILQMAVQKYGLQKKIKIYKGPAECIDQIKEKDFDLCLFHASLHHCENPVQVLKLCKQKLKKNGKVLAINEPVLKSYRTKKWFYKTLKEDPVSLGHYGGNEHIYYHNEYMKMFEQSGFKVKSEVHVSHLNPRRVIKENMDRAVEGQLVYSDKKLCLKFIILLAIKYFISNKSTQKITIAFGRRFSLLQFTFEAFPI